MDDTEKRMLEVIKDLTDNVPVNYQDMLFMDPLVEGSLKYYYSIKHITDLCEDLGKYEIVHPSEITNEWMETSLYYTCDLLKKHKDILWDMLHNIILHADDFWSINHKFITLCRDSEPDSSDKFEFLKQLESKNSCLNGKTLHEFMTEVVPSACNITGSDIRFEVAYVTNRLLQHVVLLHRAVYAAAKEYGEDRADFIAKNNKNYAAYIDRIVENNIWFNSFAYYVDESIRSNCSLIEYSIYKEQKENQ